MEKTLGPTSLARLRVDGRGQAHWVSSKPPRPSASRTRPRPERAAQGCRSISGTSSLDLRIKGAPGFDRAFALFDGDDALWLDGTSTAMHDANAAEALALTDATVLDYVRFFLFFVRGDSGAFTLIESAEELAPKTVSVETLAARRAEIAPFRLREPGADGRLGVAATIAYGDALFAAVFAVTPNGNIEMVDDDPLATLDGLAVPTPPDLAPPPVDPKPKRKPPKIEKAEVASGFERLLAAAAKPDESRPDDRQVTEAVVSVLLAEAVRASLGHTLLQRFNSQSQASGSIGQLTQLVRDFAPIVIIESEILFIEDIVVGLLDPTKTVFPEPVVGRASAISGDDSRCAVDARARSRGCSCCRSTPTGRCGTRSGPRTSSRSARPPCSSAATAARTCPSLCAASRTSS